ncbi:glycosyltransferase family 1 protein [Butyrivibrio sp. VCB2006]|uniref:glycosyltransferase family 1 protein n=1 Tax=Butyrivibrio sp. VCB2006 TaxID=1280679 RepID=UPI000409F194|nr:glycosyltransferase family 1 protein [Butyrivibrio sp. VCB2006]
MSNETKKVKVVHITKDLIVSGIGTVLMNYTCNLDKERFKTTIIAGTPIADSYRDLCRENGIEIKEIPAKGSSSLKCYMAMWKILKKGKYDIVHIHGNSATITIELLLAKAAGIKVRIAHCHNSTCDHVKVHEILSPIFKRVYTKGYACSDLAGKWMFGNSSYQVLTNGFEINKFLFNQEMRKSIRRELNIEDKFVIGNVARFNNQKNHIFLLDIFKEVAKKNPDAFLFLVGAGPLLEQIQQLIQEHPYKDRILYYGESDYVEILYNAMDMFVLPSKYEGLGIVFVEAQINGLRCVTSDQVPSEVNINNQTKFISFDKDAESWASEVVPYPDDDRQKMSELAYSSAKNYDIADRVEKLERDYLELTSLA